MNRLSKFFVELVAVGLVVGWLLIKYPETIDTFVPWLVLAIAWHLTWENVLQLEPVKLKIYAAGKRCGRMVWIIAFLIGGLISVLYWYSIKGGLGGLAKLHESYVASHPPANSSSVKTGEKSAEVSPRPPVQVPPAQSRPSPATPRKPHVVPTLPDATLRFVYPTAPALVVANPSDSIAREMKWAVVLWNMDLPERNDPLPIPVSTFDWLRPHTEGGPQNLFGSPLVAPLLKPGNRLFGSASVNCPECPRGRTFALYIVWGEGGWYSEIESETSGDLITPNNFLKETREAYFRQLEAMVPEKSRIRIGER